MRREFQHIKKLFKELITQPEDTFFWAFMTKWCFKMARRIFISFILLLLLAISVFSQTKDNGQYHPELEKAVESLGKKYALVIGVDYQGPDMLEWTVDDAVEVGWLLNKDYGFSVICAITGYPADPERKDKAVALKARAGSQYTEQTGILKLFDELITESSSENDQVLVYFSGHGKPDPNSAEVGYLIPYNGDLTNPSTTLVEMRMFETLSKRLKARHALFVVDSCYSGIAGAFSRMSEESDPKKMDIEEVKRLMGSRARQILTAGNTREKVKMLPDKKMSAYSYFFKKALEKEAGYARADYTRDGVINVSELQLYLGSKLRDRYSQTPRIFNYTEDDGEFVFVPELSDSKRKWEDWQKEMESEFAKAQANEQRMGLTAKEKKEAWENFLFSFGADNPYSTVDDDMRKKAKATVKNWIEAPTPVGQNGKYQSVSLRSVSEIITEKDVEKMLENRGFFDYRWHSQKTFINRFSDNGDGTITDKATGLLWQKGGSENPIRFLDAQDFVIQLNQKKFAGKSGWRLPTIEELASLMESEKKSGGLYISTLFNTLPKKCWTSDNQGEDGLFGKKKNENIWVVSFIEGVIFFDFLKGGNSYYVKAVCAHH